MKQTNQRIGNNFAKRKQINSNSTTRSRNLQQTILRAQSDLYGNIAGFYDESSSLWEQMWGEHMHHGYYPRNGPPKSNQQAQLDMIEEALKLGGVESVSKMVDVGCGIGGSSRYICKKFGSSSKGLTLSPKQAARGNQLNASQGLGEQVELMVANALEQPFEDASFDLVWSLESGEHMPDKAKFVRELSRVVQPGGRVVVVTWCHRNLDPGRQLQWWEEALLDVICDNYHLPKWCSLDDYQRLFEQEGLADIKTADWSEEVAPFWGKVIESALTFEGITGLLQAGEKTIRGAAVMPVMQLGFSAGLIKFVAITGRMPQS